MRGELLAAWGETWPNIWLRLTRHPNAPDEFLTEIYREFAVSPTPPQEPPPAPPEAYDADGVLVRKEDVALAQIYERSLIKYERQLARYEETLSGIRVRQAFRILARTLVTSEQSAIEFLERAYAIADDVGGDVLANHYFSLVEAFLAKFNLRYDLRRPFTMHPTLPGLFAGMMRALKEVAAEDADLQPIYYEFEEALRDLTADRSERVIKICIQRQVNLLEAFGQKAPGVTANTLGRICDQIGTWPHESITDAIKNLYKFSCDYPGIRHAGNAAHRIRAIEMKDMIAVSVLLAGFTPYLACGLDAEAIYSG
jgi:hypothetical protein